MNKEVQTRLQGTLRFCLCIFRTTSSKRKIRAEMVNFTVICSIVLLSSLCAKAVHLVEPTPKNLFAITGSQLFSTCIVAGDNGKPPVIVKFQRKKTKEVFSNWKDIPDTDRVFQTNKTEGDKVIATLHFVNITVEDGFDFVRYSCAGFSTDGKKARRNFIVMVTPREDLPVARVIPNTTVSYGDTVRLYCNLTHKNNEQTTPISKVTFLKNGIPVRKTNDITQPLILADVTPRDGGDYGCQILVSLHNDHEYNVAPTTTAYVHVRVRFPFKESKIVADIGDSVALVCSAQGFPLNVTWNKNQPGSTAVIKPSGRFILQGQCRYCQSVLVIQNVTVEDSGNYSCNALGDPGQHVFLVEVRVNSTLSVATTTMASRYMTTIFPAFLWIWWPL